MRLSCALALSVLVALPAGAAPPAARPAAAPPPPARQTVIFLGDSLTAGLGVEENQAYPALLAARLAAMGQPVRLVNAGVSGDTTAGGLRRLEWLLRQGPDVLVVGLGGNDALRGATLGEVEHNLREIVHRCQAAGVRVLLLGMQIPTNYGPDYTAGFRAIYPRIAKDMRVPLVPFLLEGVGGVPGLNQPDGIHPTALGHQKVAETVLPYLRAVLAAKRGVRAKGK